MLLGMLLLTAGYAVVDSANAVCAVGGQHWPGSLHSITGVWMECSGTGAGNILRCASALSAVEGPKDSLPSAVAS